jgi:hypothetical protein
MSTAFKLTPASKIATKITSTDIVSSSFFAHLADEQSNWVLDSVLCFPSSAPHYWLVSTLVLFAVRVGPCRVTGRIVLVAFITVNGFSACDRTPQPPARQRIRLHSHSVQFLVLVPSFLRQSSAGAASPFTSMPMPALQ